MHLHFKNLEKILIFFFATVSIALVTVGIMRAKKTPPPPETPNAIPPQMDNTMGGVTTTGSSYQTPWGNTVASIVVKNGKIVAVSMPSVPNSPPSIYAEPYLIDQALKAGSANIQGVTGATFTSIAFKQSLENAIAVAQQLGQDIIPNTGATSVTSAPKPTVPRKYRDDDDDD